MKTSLGMQQRTGRALRLLAVLLALGAVLVAPVSPSAAAPPSAECVYRATYIADVTVPDDTVFAPGATFAKTWRLRNDGTCAWGPGKTVDSLAFIAGNVLGSPKVVPLTAEIGPGKTGDVTVMLTAPTAPSTYRSEWMLRRTDGTTFGLGATGRTPFYVQIIVRAAGSTPTAGQRIQFAPGATTAAVQGSVTAPARKEYVLRALAGQVMTIAIVSANNRANFSIQGVSDGTPYKRLENEDRYHTFRLPATQDYLVKVAAASGTSSYVLAIAIAP